MSVGVPVLDADHKTLIGLINLLNRSIGDREGYVAVYSVLGSLEEYAAQHFTREEEMMRAAHCPQLEVHQRTHQGFALQVADLKARYEENRNSVRARECLGLLNAWLVNHICTTDMNYRAWLVGHAEALAVGAPPPPPQGNARDLRSLRILALDDNRNFSEILCAILNSVGINQVATVGDIVSAKAALVDDRPDLLIADWHVGADSGLDLVKWLRQGPPQLAKLPVLMISGHERLANRDLALLAGADDFMEKPVTARGLLICLSRLAERAA